MHATPNCLLSSPLFFMSAGGAEPWGDTPLALTPLAVNPSRATPWQRCTYAWCLYLVGPVVRHGGCDIARPA